jgi:hydroxymethylglutaryl-CoA lyase
MMMAPKEGGLQIIEVGPRDGLQDQDVLIPVEDKIRFIELLAKTGVQVLEVTSFVDPRRIPQLADAEQVFREVAHLQEEGLRLLSLVPNMTGYERARSVGVKSVAIFTAASESFNRNNINASIDESMDRFVPICEDAVRNDVWVRGYISTAFGCPYEGEVSPKSVAHVARRLRDLGCREIALGDTIGVATPQGTRDVIEAVGAVVDVDQIALHMHDTVGRAMINIEMAWSLGVTRFDASTGGLGGCPYAPGAPGNVATSRVVEYFRQLEVDTNVDLDQVDAARSFIAETIDRLGRRG